MGYLAFTNMEGDLAQLVEHVPRKHEVAGSIPEFSIYFLGKIVIPDLR